MPEQDPRLRAALQNSEREAADAIASLRAMTAKIKKEHAEFNKERDKRRQERAAEARSGDLGRDMQRLQDRVDRGQTSWDDVVAGRDKHASAAVARDNMNRNVADLARTLRDDPEFVEEQRETRRLADEVEAERE